MRYLAFVVAMLAGATAAFGQIDAFTVSGGYSRLHTGRTGGLFYDNNGGYIDGDVLFPVRGAPFPLLLGGGISGSGYNEDEFVPVSGEFFDERFRSDLGLLSFEGRAAIPIPLGFLPRGFFVMPRIGAGLLVNDYSIDSIATGFTEDHTGAAFEIRPAVQVGYSWGTGSVGAEVAYMSAWGDFGKLGATAWELRAGVFVRFRF